MLDHAGAEGALPVLRERPEHRRHVRPDRLTLGARCAVPSGLLQVAEQLRVIELVDRVVADPGHWGRVLAVLQLKQFGELRGPGHYLRTDLSLDMRAARLMLAVLDAMRAHMAAVPSGSSPGVGVSFYKDRHIRRGEIVLVPPGG